jgi:GNAT superfamily N-acetyltransferase
MPSASQAPTRIRTAVPTDAAICGPICFEAFAAINRQHNFELEFPSPEVATGLLGMLFSHPNFYCVVAEVDGRIVGSNCLDERSAIAGVGPITVNPGIQDQGLGRILMNAVLERARQKNFVGVRLLQAAFHGRSMSLYTKLGFAVREPMSVMCAPVQRPFVAGYTVRPATEEDLPAANALCEAVHGHSRAGELRDGILMGTAVVAERDGRMAGHASGFGYFGYAVAENNAALKALLGAGSNYSGPGVIVPTRNAEVFRWCLENGYRVLHPMTLMSIGLYNEPQGAYLPSVLY